MVIYVYQREGRSVPARVCLGILRVGVIAVVLALLNYPTLTRTTTLTEPSVVAVLFDNSLSMSVHDANGGQSATGPTRLARPPSA